jgi:hypothetical protein
LKKKTLVFYQAACCCAQAKKMVSNLCITMTIISNGQKTRAQLVAKYFIHRCENKLS